VNNVSWSLNPWSLLLLRTTIDITGGAIRSSEQVYVKGQASFSLLSPENFSLQDTQIFVPAKSVLSQFRLPVAVTANGRFRVDINTLEMTPTCTTLMGTGAWLNAQVDTPQQPVNLGSFDADLSCENGNLTVNILPDNRLQLSANIVVDGEGKYKASGQFKPEDNLPAVIQQAADSFFQKNPQGFYLIRL
jgi:general secretion pathway protein N